MTTMYYDQPSSLSRHSPVYQHQSSGVMESNSYESYQMMMMMQQQQHHHQYSSSSSSSSSSNGGSPVLTSQNYASSASSSSPQFSSYSNSMAMGMPQVYEMMYSTTTSSSYQQHQQVAPLMVQPGLPTPIELCVYDSKAPTGYLHLTPGNQTVEFLDGVANMPSNN